MLEGFYDTIVWFFAILYRFIVVAIETIKDHEFRTLGLLMAFMLILGTVFYTNVEQIRPLDALYLSAITLTTVGYGDITPHTDLGKIFTIGYLFTGIGILLSFVNVIANHALKDRISVKLDSGFNKIRMPRPARIARNTRSKFMRYRYRAK